MYTNSGGFVIKHATLHLLRSLKIFKQSYLFLLLYSFIIKHTDGRSVVLNIPVVELKEGKMVGEIEKSDIPTSIVVKMEKMEPVYQ